MEEQRRTMASWVLTGGVVLLVLVAVFLLRPYLFGNSHGRGPHKVAAAKVLAKHKMPKLFNGADVLPVQQQVGTQAGHAEQLMQTWWKAHGTAPNDQAFLTWVEHTLPPPPSKAARTQQAKELQPMVSSSRTKKQLKAANWLKKFGKEVVWLGFEHLQSPTLANNVRTARAKDLQAGLKLTKQISTDLTQKYQASAPYILDPALHPNAKPKNRSGACPCSYPAGPAATSATARAFLAFLYPQQSKTYRNMEAEIDYARVAMGTHLPSDITAGSTLGDLVGEYILVTRGLGSEAKVTSSLSTAA